MKLICPFHCVANQHPSILTLQRTKYFSVIAEDAQHFFETSCQFIFPPFAPCQKELQAVIRKAKMQKHICRPLFRSCLLFEAFQAWVHNSTLPRTWVSETRVRTSMTVFEVVGTQHLYRSSYICPMLVTQKYSKWDIQNEGHKFESKDIFLSSMCRYFSLWDIFVNCEQNTLSSMRYSSYFISSRHLHL